jgi:hypothetical protein
VWLILTDVSEESAASIFSINKASVLKVGTCRRGGKLETSTLYTVSLTLVDSLRTPSGPLLSAHGLLFYHVDGGSRFVRNKISCPCLECNPNASSLAAIPIELSSA